MNEESFYLIQDIGMREYNKEGAANQEGIQDYDYSLL